MGGLKLEVLPEEMCAAGTAETEGKARVASWKGSRWASVSGELRERLSYPVSSNIYDEDVKQTMEFAPYPRASS